MQRLFPRSRALALASALAAICAACESQSSGPLRPSGTNRVDSLEIRGPLEIPPGGSARLSVIARLLDGSTEDVTSYVVWRVSPPTRLSIDPTGLARAHDAGDADVTAAYNSRATTRDVIVVPPVLIVCRESSPSQEFLQYRCRPLASKSSPARERV